MPSHQLERALQSADLAQAAAIEAAQASLNALPVGWGLSQLGSSLAAGDWLWGVFDGAGQHLNAYVCVRFGYEEAEILSIATHPNALRRGHARLLLDRLEQLAKTRNQKAVWLEVRASNTAALGLYERYGFVRQDLRRGYYATLGGEREDAVTMRKGLTLHSN